MVKLILAAFVFVIYVNSLGNDYNLDDELVTKNHKLTSKGISAIPEIFSSPYYSDDQGYRYEYRPIVLTSFAIEHQLFGESPGVSHLFNLIFYIFTVIVLFNCLRVVFKHQTFFFPLAIALLFIAHPTHTEVVASIKNRDEILSLMGGFLALLYALRYGDNKKFWFLVLSVLFFILGILSKKSILPFSVLIPIAMILFTRASFVQVFVISLMMSLITTIFSPLYFVSSQVLLFLALLSIPAIVFWVARTEDLSFKSIFQWLKDQSRNIESQQADIQATKPNSENSPSMSFVSIILYSAASIGLVALGLAFDYFALSFLGICFSVFFIFKSTNKQLQWPVFLFAMLTAVIAYVYHNALLVKATVIFYTYLVLAKHIRLNYVFIGLILAAFTFTLVSIDPFQSHIIPVYLVTIFLYTRKNKYLKIVGLIFAVLISLFHSPFQASNSISHVLLLSLITYDYLKLKGRPLQRAWFIYLPVMLIISYLFFNDLRVEWQFENAEVIRTETPEIFPASGRELEFVEMPLTAETPISEKVGTSFYVLAKYLKLVIIPYPLGFYYGYREIPVVEWTHWLSILSIILHTIMGLIALFFIRSRPILSYGIIFYLGSLSVFSNLAAPVAGLMADRYLFSASLGLCIIIVWALFKIFSVNLNDTKLQLKNVPKNVIVILGMILFLYSAETFARNFKWKDQLTLFQNDIEHLEESGQAHNLLAIHLTKKGFTETDQTSRTRYFSEAKKHFEKALEIDETFFNATFDLGRVASALGEYPQAIAAFKRTFAMDSTFYNALIEVALIYDQQNMPERAIPVYEKIISIDSIYLPAYTNLSMNYFKQKKFQEAIDVNKEALRIMPNAYDPYVNVGKTFFNMGKKDSALVYFEKAYQLDQTDAMLPQIMGEIKRELGVK